MKLRAFLGRIRPLSISQLNLAFYLALAAILALLAGLALRELNALSVQIRQSEQKLARQELDEAIQILARHVDQYSHSIAEWDETRLILDNTAYYAYWRNARLPSAGILSETVDAVELYDLNGNNLNTDRRGETEKLMAERIDLDRLKPAFLRENGHDHLIQYFRIYRDSSQNEVIGFGGIKIDFVGELRGLHKFRYLRLDTLQIDARENQVIEIKDLARHSRFDSEPNPEVRALETLVSRYFFHILIAAGVLMLIGHRLTVSVLAKPLRRISEHIEGMRQGHAALLGEQYRGLLPLTELEHVRESLNDYRQQLEEMHINLASKHEELWLLAHRDALTGSHNRRAFDEDWDALCAASRSAVGDVAFALFDCDHFKAINDTYGHQIGDRVIQGIAESLLGALRGSDRLYRLGGDEFATLLRGADREQARIIAERCLDRVHTHDFAALGIKEPVRISIGICHSSDMPDDALHALHRFADIAMYHAKRPGQQKIAFFVPEMAESSEAVVSNRSTNAVYDAMRYPERIVLHYQSIVGMPDRQPVYCEALTRIRDGDSLLLPSNIFPVVEARRLEVEFDLAIIDRVEQDLEQGLSALAQGVSINISGPGIVQEKIINRLLSLAARFADRKLVVEVTETALITQISHASANLNKLRQAGYLIALDDFGNGYSSLRYLASMPVDLVKFDITMIRALDASGRQAVFVEDLARMIKDAGYQLVAEGIETESTARRIAEMGFSYGQGYLFGRPERPAI